MQQLSKVHHTNGWVEEGVGMGSPNRIASMVGKIKANLPTALQPWALSLMFNSQVLITTLELVYEYESKLCLVLARFDLQSEALLSMPHS